jgi:hypothetical protein
MSDDVLGRLAEVDLEAAHDGLLVDLG